MKKIFLTLLLPLLLIFSGCHAQDVKGDLKISMLNIGHGDSIVIQTKKQTILIDTGKHDEHARFVRELEKLSVTKIDKLIFTHPHIDHIGGARMLISPNEKELTAYPYLKKISVEKVYDNGIAYTSKLYRNYMKTINAKGIPRQSLKTGDTLDFGNGVKFKVLSPTAEFVTTVNGKTFDKSDREHNINNGSIVGKLTYKNFSMMFTGDCEKESEAKIVANNNAKDLKCDVLKAGHHGIGTSSTKEFVKTINPSVVLISASNKKENNVLVGNPNARVLKNYLAYVDKENVFCTRFNGTITVTSDGKNFSVTPEKEEVWAEKWIAHKKTLKKK